MSIEANTRNMVEHKLRVGLPSIEKYTKLRTNVLKSRSIQNMIEIREKPYIKIKIK